MRNFFVAVIFGCTVTIAAYADGPALKSKDILSLLVGHTYAGVEDDGPYEEKAFPNGRIIGRDVDGKYKGQWKIAGDQYCTRDDDDGEDGWDCSKVFIRGSEVIFVDEDGKKYPAKLSD